MLQPNATIVLILIFLISLYSVRRKDKVETDFCKCIKKETEKYDVEMFLHLDWSPPVVNSLDGHDLEHWISLLCVGLFCLQ